MNNNLYKTKYGFYSVSQTPNEKELRDYYANKYYQNNIRSHKNTYSEDELNFFLNRARVAEYILSKSSAKSLLDVGTGEGFFANYFYKKSWDVTTLDFSKHGIEKHNKELIPFHIQGNIFDSLNTIVKNNKKYDLINLSNVLEHVIDPKELLLSLKKIMHKDSYLRISVPNDFSSFQEFLLSKKYTTQTWVCIPDHLHYFSFQSLRNFLKDLGFIPEISLGEFPIEIFLANETSNYTLNNKNGSYAHKARIEIDQFLFNQGIDKYINFYTSAANIDLSRQVVIFTKMEELIDTI